MFCSTDRLRITYDHRTSARQSTIISRFFFSIILFQFLLFYGDACFVSQFFFSSKNRQRKRSTSYFSGFRVFGRRGNSTAIRPNDRQRKKYFRRRRGEYIYKNMICSIVRHRQITIDCWGHPPPIRTRRRTVFARDLRNSKSPTRAYVICVLTTIYDNVFMWREVRTSFVSCLLFVHQRRVYVNYYYRYCSCCCCHQPPYTLSMV